MVVIHIHNYYSDLLLSVRVLFDRIIFPSHFIKNYEFNIANRTFTLSKKDYKPTFSFPTATVSLMDEIYTFGERPNVIQQLNVSNTNQIPVLGDYETGRQLLLQEEHIQTTLSIQINCESQLQAKEVDFYIRRWLPVSKYIQLFDFTSFLEISPLILQTLGMDYNHREIANLFTRLNKNTGEVEYCFSVNYKPLLKLESSTVSLGDGSSRSFPVNLELTYQVQMPMWLVWEEGSKTIDRINMDFSRFGNEPISQNNCRTLIIKKYDNSDEYLKVHMNVVIPDLDTWWCGYTYDNEDALLVAQRYLDQDVVRFSDFDFYAPENQVDNPYLVNLLRSNTCAFEDFQRWISNNYLKSVVLNRLMLETDITLKDLVYFLAHGITLSLNPGNKLIKCCIDCKELTYNEIQNYVVGYLEIFAPKIISDIKKDLISYLDLYEFLETNTTKSKQLQFHSETGLNNFAVLQRIFKNNYTTFDLYEYYRTNKTINSYLTLDLEDGTIIITDIISLLKTLGLSPIRNTSETILFSIHFSQDLLIFSESFIYNIMDATGTININIPPFYVDIVSNTVYFKLRTSDLPKFGPTLTTPLVVQICERIHIGESKTNLSGDYGRGIIKR